MAFNNYRALLRVSLPTKGRQVPLNVLRMLPNFLVHPRAPKQCPKNPIIFPFQYVSHAYVLHMTATHVTSVLFGPQNIAPRGNRSCRPAGQYSCLQAYIQNQHFEMTYYCPCLSARNRSTASAMGCSSFLLYTEAALCAINSAPFSRPRSPVS